MAAAAEASSDLLLEELQRLLNALLVLPPPLTAAQPHTAQACTLLEHILSRGLKSARPGPPPRAYSAR